MSILHRAQFQASSSSMHQVLDKCVHDLPIYSGNFRHFFVFSHTLLNDSFCTRKVHRKVIFWIFLITFSILNEKSFSFDAIENFFLGKCIHWFFGSLWEQRSKTIRILLAVKKKTHSVWYLLYSFWQPHNSWSRYQNTHTENVCKLLWKYT